MNFAELLEIYQGNVWPAMLEDLGLQLGVSPTSLARLGIGWIPAEACWVFPERDNKGTIIGLSRRFKDGRKFSIKGSERGLTYPLNESFQAGSEPYTPGSHNWVHTSEVYPCPICKKTDWCLVSAENPSDPKAVICGRTSEGATRPQGDAGYLHVRKPEGVVSATPLPLSEMPVLIVEGQSDTAAALDLGYIGVGKPSAAGGTRFLREFLVGREVVVIGENDAGAGRDGMEKTFQALKPMVKKIVKLMPPAGIKDLRAWKQAGLTSEKLHDAILLGDPDSNSEVLESKAPLDIAELWLRQHQTLDGLVILRKFMGSWFRYNGRHYEAIDEDAMIRGKLYEFLRGKKVKVFRKQGEVSLEAYETTRSKISDILDAMNMSCPVAGSPPCWLGDEALAADVVVFANGLLDIASLELSPPTPRLFTLNSLPYDYDPNAACPVWLQALGQIFPGDPLSIMLLQEWFGYNMTADTSQEKMMVFIGRPGAGKGTVLEGLRCVLGKGQVASTSFPELCSSFGLQPLVGKLAIILPDVHVPRQLDGTQALEVIKKITGRDPVDIQRKFKEAMTDHRLCGRFTMSVNELPELPDHVRSLERRLLLLNFTQSFAGHEDRTLKDRIPTEAMGIALWALAGLRRLRAQGRFTVPTSSAPMLEEFRRTISPLTEFVEDCCTTGAGDECFVMRRMLWDVWRSWGTEHGIGVGSARKFSQRLFSLFPACTLGRKRFGEDTMPVVLGLRLTEDAVNKYAGGVR